MKKFLLIILIFTSLYGCNSYPTAKDMEVKRITDSLRVSDSLAMVQAEKQRIADSISPTPKKPDIEFIKTNSRQDDYHNITVFAKIRNNTKSTIKEIWLQSVLEDNDGNIINTGLGSGENIAPNAIKVIEITAGRSVGTKKYHVEIEKVEYY
jgi:hypothetical protein